MSSETKAWAKEQKTGHPITKHVLMELANWANPTGVVEYMSIKRLAEVVETSARTVQRHIDRLENDLKLIRRVQAFRPDGGQLANGFELVGYEPPMLARMQPGKAAKAPPRQSVTPPCQDGTGPVTDRHQGGDTAVTPNRNLILPLSTTDVVDAPQAVFDDENGKGKARALPDDWEAPAISDLQPEARALVTQWPSGAYAAMCANFRNHWTDKGTKNRRKSNWPAALANWLIRVHAEVMRSAKAGVSFGAVAAPAQAAVKREAPRPVLAKRRENDQSKAIHAKLKVGLGDVIYSQWLGISAILMDDPGVTVVSPSRFHAEWIENHFQQQIKAAAQAVTGTSPRWVRFDVAAMSNQGEKHHG